MNQDFAEMMVQFANLILLLIYAILDYMKWLVFLFLFYIHSSQASDLCVVISGAKKDHNGALQSWIIAREKSNYGKFKCEVFDSWDAADAYIKKSSLKKDEQLLIVQTAHGGPGGSAKCNAQDVGADHILSYLENYQRKYQVGAIINSCYSGDLMKKKILHDSILDDTKRLDKLCLVTSSSFGMVSYGSDVLGSIPSKNENLENHAGVFGSGLISSMAWESSGVTDYWINADLADSKKILENISDFINSSIACQDNNSKSLAKVCSNPSISPDLLLALRDLETNPNVKDYLSPEALDEMTSFITKNKNSQNKLNDFEKLKFRCYLSLDEKFRGILDYRDNYSNFDFKAQLVLKLKEFTSSEDGETCIAFSNKEIENASKNSGMAANTFAGYPNVDFLNNTSPLNRQITNLIIKDEKIIKSLNDFLKHQNTIGKYINTSIDESVLNPEKLVGILNSNNNRSQCSVVNSKNMMGYLLAESFVSPEYNDDSNPIAKLVKFTPYHIIKNFKAASLLSKELVSRKDQMRREACRNFTF